MQKVKAKNKQLARYLQLACNGEWSRIPQHWETALVLEGESDPEEDEAGTTLNATLLTDKLRFSNHTVVKFKQTQKVAHIADMISQVKDNPTFI
jgi:hypothetical protein